MNRRWMIPCEDLAYIGERLHTMQCRGGRDGARSPSILGSRILLQRPSQMHGDRNQMRKQKVKGWKACFSPRRKCVADRYASKTVGSARIELYHVIYNHSNAKTASLAENAKQIIAISLPCSKLGRISLANACPCTNACRSIHHSQS